MILFHHLFNVMQMLRCKLILEKIAKITTRTMLLPKKVKWIHVTTLSFMKSIYYFSLFGNAEVRSFVFYTRKKIYPVFVYRIKERKHMVLTIYYVNHVDISTCKEESSSFTHNRFT